MQEKWYNSDGHQKCNSWHGNKMVTQPEEAFCVLKFNATTSVTTFHCSFQKKFQKKFSVCKFSSLLGLSHHFTAMSTVALPVTNVEIMSLFMPITKEFLTFSLNWCKFQVWVPFSFCKINIWNCLDHLCSLCIPFWN
jgi:hypothetical protein